MSRSGFRRAIEVRSQSDSRMVAEVEDDFHHFSVTLDHRNGLIESLAGHAVRHPWSLCPAAAERLGDLVGGALTPLLPEALARSPIREHCTHLYDLACLAIVHAAKKTVRRRWDMVVGDRIDGQAHALLSIDQRSFLEWHIDDASIIAPYPVSLKGNFTDWAATNLPPEQAEAALLLRRAVFVSGGRRGDLDLRATAAEGARNMGGCFVMRAGVAEHANRVRGATRQFSDAVPPLGDCSCSA